MLKKIQTHW